MRRIFTGLVVLTCGMALAACSDEGNEVPSEAVDRGIVNQEMHDQGQERDIISPAMDTDPTTDDRADNPRQGGQESEEHSYLPGAEDPEEMLEPDPRDRLNPNSQADD